MDGWWIWCSDWHTPLDSTNQTTAHAHAHPPHSKDILRRRKPGPYDTLNARRLHEMAVRMEDFFWRRVDSIVEVRALFCWSGRFWFLVG